MADKKERGAPASGSVSLPFEINKSKTVTAEALESLCHASERGQQGAFPLGVAGQFHSGTDLLVERGKPICAIADGEVVAARIGVGPGEHPWGDTGFVLLRHPLAGDKSIFSLFVHLQREPLHPDRAQAGWLRRLLLDSVDPGKPKWRVMGDAPTWKDEDKGSFSPDNVQKGKLLPAGVYEEEDRSGLYVKLKGQWVKANQEGKAKVKELPPWAEFDLEEAAKKSQTIAALKDGQVAILDADKKDGKRRWTVEAGEPIGVAGEYLGRPVVHWSVFSKDAVFPTGSLPEKEFGAKDEVKLSELDLNEERGDVEHTKKLLEALDPQKKTIAKMPQDIPLPGEVELFYRTPAECWRSRYLAVKGLTEFALDVDKFLQQDRYQSHPEDQREAFKKNTQAFLFWKELAKADDFPQDGKALFVHPATAMRLMHPVPAQHWIEFRLHDSGGRPLAGARYRVKLPGDRKEIGTLDKQGAARHEQLAAGDALIELVDVDSAAWSAAEAEASEEVELSMQASGLDAGESVRFQIFRLYRERAGEELASLEGKLDDKGSARVKWRPGTVEGPDGSFIFKASAGGGWRKSAPLAVHHRVTASRWSKDVVKDGEEVRLRAELKGVADGEAATIVIYEKCWRHPQDCEAKRLEAKAKGGAFEASWTAHPATDAAKRDGTDHLDFFFTVETSQLSSTSGLLVLLLEAAGT